MARADAEQHAQVLGEVLIGFEMTNGWDWERLHWSAHTLASLLSEDDPSARRLSRLVEDWADDGQSKSMRMSVDANVAFAAVSELARLATALAEGEASLPNVDGILADFESAVAGVDEEYGEWSLNLGDADVEVLGGNAAEQEDSDDSHVEPSTMPDNEQDIPSAESNENDGAHLLDALGAKPASEFETALEPADEIQAVGDELESEQSKMDEPGAEPDFESAQKDTPEAEGLVVETPASDEVDSGVPKDEEDSGSVPVSVDLEPVPEGVANPLELLPEDSASAEESARPEEPVQASEAAAPLPAVQQPEILEASPAVSQAASDKAERRRAREESWEEVFQGLEHFQQGFALLSKGLLALREQDEQDDRD